MVCENTVYEGKRKKKNMIITYIKDMEYAPFFIFSVGGINAQLCRMVLNMAKCVILSKLLLVAESVFRNNMCYILTRAGGSLLLCNK